MSVSARPESFGGGHEGGPTREFRTLLERLIWQRRFTLEEFVDYAETFARENGEPGTLSVRHLKRLTAGAGPNGRPLGRPRAATARLLERIFGRSIEELLAAPWREASSSYDAARRPREQVDLNAAFDWLDVHARWSSDTTRRRVSAAVAAMNIPRGRGIRSVRGKRSEVAQALAEYYGNDAPGPFGRVVLRVDGHRMDTTIVARPEWLDLACQLPAEDHIEFAVDEPAVDKPAVDDRAARSAVQRLAEATAAGVPMADLPIYRLLCVDVRSGALSGQVGLASFVEYALTADLLERELAEAVVSDVRPGALPLRDRYLPGYASVLDLPARLCAGGTAALCAIARPADPYRGDQDYALLVQERSDRVVNAAGSLAVIPKGFHQPLVDYQAEAGIGATLQREMEEELFQRTDVDSTRGVHNAPVPMHPSRLSGPMRWLTDVPDRLRIECTAFGLNLVSGNYEFTGLIVIDDEEFWPRYGGQIEANWEAAGIRVCSTQDRLQLAELVADERWNNEGLFAFVQGLRRLAALGGKRVELPDVDCHVQP